MKYVGRRCHLYYDQHPKDFTSRRVSEPTPYNSRSLGLSRRRTSRLLPDDEHDDDDDDGNAVADDTVCMVRGEVSEVRPGLDDDSNCAGTGIGADVDVEFVVVAEPGRILPS